MSYNKNILLATDVYKMGHMEFYPEGTTKVYSYLCARSNKKYEKSLFFGLQYYLIEYLQRSITMEDAVEFLEYRASILGSPAPDAVRKKITDLALLGYIPLEIKAVPEGVMVENKNVLCTVTNTHPDFAWVVGFFESLLLKVWNTTTVATASHKYKTLVKNFAEETSDSLFLIPFLVHDFGYRGCSSDETAELSGAAHLVNFCGTDTITAIKIMKDFYKGEGMIGASVPASEHSVMCAYGREGEIEAFRAMLRQNPTGIVSIVSDTYDFWNVMVNFTEELKEEILARDGKVVFRPDSGDPKKILCGDPDAPMDSPESLGALRLLHSKFGGKVNSKGYIELNPKVGLIYGDGMYYERFEDILKSMKEMEFATTNLVIGIGGLLLQQHNRDDLGFAFKATFAEINGQKVELFKDPVTDTGKRSHKGLMFLTKDSDGKFVTVDQCTEAEEEGGLLNTVYKNGVVLGRQTLSQIRARSEA